MIHRERGKVASTKLHTKHLRYGNREPEHINATIRQKYKESRGDAIERKKYGHIGEKLTGTGRTHR